MKRRIMFVGVAGVGAAFVLAMPGGTAAAAPAANSPTEPNLIAAPAVLSARVDPPALGDHGARTLVVGRVATSVTTCQLKLLSRQSFPVVYASNVKRCHVNFYAYVTVGANPTLMYRSVAFELIARNSAEQFSRGVFYIQVAPKGSTYVAPPPPIVSTAPPPLPKAPPAPPKAPKVSPPPSLPQIAVTQDFSPNWSGYELAGSNFTYVSGTFTVPRLQVDETCQTSEAQWVGIDGVTGDNDLIQAGISETPYDDFGICLAPTEFYVRAVWEILPAPSMDIPSITAHVGDRVTVNISETSTPGYWSISVADDTNGETFTTDQRYSGPKLSAEWITESARNALHCSGGVDGIADECTETAYEPAVTFAGLDFNRGASVNSVTEWTMNQQYVDVSTPSIVPDLAYLMDYGFTTSYTGY